MTPRRDDPGPIHHPVPHPSSVIDGVVLVSPPSIAYEHGILTELYRPEWEGLFAPGEAVEHLYTINNPNGGARNEWYYHEHTLDRYILLQGTLRLGLYDGREDSPTFRGFEIVTLNPPGGSDPSAIRIPAGVWHSLDWGGTSGIIVNLKSPSYSREHPDKFRIPLADLPEEISWEAL